MVAEGRFRKGPPFAVAIGELFSGGRTHGGMKKKFVTQPTLTKTSRGGIVRWQRAIQTEPVVRETSYREALGKTLRSIRTTQNLTLREVSASVMVSLSYLSEIERSHKEVSSDILESICQGLDIRLPDLLIEVALVMRGEQGNMFPDVIPAEMSAELSLV